MLADDLAAHQASACAAVRARSTETGWPPASTSSAIIDSTSPVAAMSLRVGAAACEALDDGRAAQPAARSHCGTPESISIPPLDVGVAERGRQRLGVPLREAQHPRRADGAVGHQPARLAIRPRVPAPEADVQAEPRRSASAARRRSTCGSNVSGRSQSTCLPAASAAETSASCCGVGAAIEDGVHVVARERLLQVGVDRYARQLTDGGCCRGGIADRPQLHPPRARKGPQMLLSHPAHAHEGDTRHQPTLWALRPSACRSRASATAGRSRHLGHADLPERPALRPRAGSGAHGDDVGPLRCPGAHERGRQIVDRLDALGLAAERAGVRDPVDVHVIRADRREHVVERRAALAHLQPLDHRIAAVVAEHDDELMSCDHGAEQTRSSASGTSRRRRTRKPRLAPAPCARPTRPRSRSPCTRSRTRSRTSPRPRESQLTLSSPGKPPADETA